MMVNLWFYVLDATALPGVIVLVTRDEELAEETCARYANQVGRPCVVAAGPPPDSSPLPSSQPTIPGIQ